MHMKVKDMSRRQQRAVFANLTDGPTPYSTEMKGTRERLARRGLADSKQAKIDRIMSNKHLTHRQQMDRIAKLNKPARVRTGGSALVIKVPSGLDRPSFNKILIEKKQKTTNLYEINGLLLTQKEYRKGLARPPKGSDVIDAPTGINRAVFNGLIAKRKPTPGTYIKTGGLALPMKDYRKGILRDARLRGKAFKKPIPGVTKVTRLPLPEQVKDPKKLPGFKGPTKVTRIPLAKKNQGILYKKDKFKVNSEVLLNGEQVTITDVEGRNSYKIRKNDGTEKSVFEGNLHSIKHKNKSFKLLKKQGIHLKATADTDKDGVPNAKDCKPLNPKEQGILHGLAEKAKGSAKKYYGEHYTTKGKRALAKKEFEKYKEKNITAAAERKAEREKSKFEAHKRRKEKQRAKKIKKVGKAVKGVAKELFG